MKKIILSLILIFSLVLIGCEEIDVSKLSDEDLARVSEKAVVCNKPYIRVGIECCLDQNDNSICDDDEKAIEKEEEKQEVVEETENIIVIPDTSSESKIDLESDCPQFKEVKRSFLYKEVERVWYDDYDSVEGDKDINGWKIDGGYEDWEGFFARCHKGSRTGENVNYYYCGEDSISPLKAVKKVIDSSGNIKETLTKEIIIVFNGKGEFIETVCK